MLLIRGSRDGHSSSATSHAALRPEADPHEPTYVGVDANPSPRRQGAEVNTGAKIGQIHEDQKVRSQGTWCILHISGAGSRRTWLAFNIIDVATNTRCGEGVCSPGT